MNFIFGEYQGIANPSEKVALWATTICRYVSAKHTKPRDPHTVELGRGPKYYLYCQRITQRVVLEGTSPSERCALTINAREAILMRRGCVSDQELTIQGRMLPSHARHVIPIL